MPENNMELAIYNCRDDFARKLFIRCFTDQGEVHEIISNEYLEQYNNDTKFRAFAPKVKLVKLKSDESDKPQWYDNLIWRNFKQHYKNEFKRSRDFEKSSIALQVVPFPYFTANKISDSIHSIFTLFTFKVFLFLFIPRCVKETDPSLAVNISFSIFLLWIELILHLRLMLVIGIYVYHVIIIFKTIFPFIFFIVIVIFAFAHTMFVLLRNPIDIKTKDSTYSGVATNSLTNEILDIKLKSDFDPMSSDNPYTSFSRAIMATYFWISSDWVQKDDFDYWAVDVYTLIASIFLVIVLQNMLIAYMSNIYEDSS
ncbi:unnamed protein product [Rhizophagus irregularis]|nr:unnamed protein product [Rhizophagus irregularis]